MMRLKNGLTLVIYGRPGLYIRVSTDPSGIHWSERLTIVPPGQPYEDTCSYGALLALDDDTALIAYSDFNLPNSKGELCKGIRVRKIKITKKGQQ